jgi:hypothetical protein
MAVDSQVIPIFLKMHRMKRGEGGRYLPFAKVPHPPSSKFAALYQMVFSYLAPEQVSAARCAAEIR